MQGVKKIDSISLRVRDLDKATKFYMETLGLEEIYRMDDTKMRGYGVGDNSATINLEQAGGGAQLVIQVDRVDETRKALEAKGVRFEGPTDTIPNIGKGARFRIPTATRSICSTTPSSMARLKGLLARCPMMDERTRTGALPSPKRWRSRS